jgi:hypothetical protein
MILIHRWLGIVLSLLFVVWFASGIAMIYAGGMPSLSREKRLEKMPALNLAQVRVTASDAVQKAELDRPPAAVTLLNVMDRPAYRFDGREATVFADTGEVLGGVGKTEALTIASRFLNLPEEKLHYAGLLTEPDQWTITEQRQLPMHKITVDDDAHTELYVSEVSAEVGLQTTRGTRALAWVAAIPHWLYFTSLRVRGELWTQVVIWSSGIGSILAVLGIVLGLIQFSRRKPHTPYAGWMWWHYVTGAVFGVFTLTWVFSGLLSMEPWNWASGGGSGSGMRQAFTGGALDLSRFPTTDAAAWAQMLPGREIKEIEFLRIQDEPHYAVRGVEPEPVLVSANPLRIRHEPFSMESLMQRAKQGNADVPIAESQMLSQYDSYYYARGQERPLPVLRLKFADPDSTWFYIDPKMSRIVARFTHRQRVERWIYHGLHSLDFSFWYYNRPLWDIGMIVLSLGGLASSGIGLYIGLKRLLRHVRRIARNLGPGTVGKAYRVGSGSSK